jgi:hypothetical protein
MFMAPIVRPLPGHAPDYCWQFYAQLDQDDLMQALADTARETSEVLGQLSVEKASFAYAPGKWNIKQVLQHINDCERILSYRALRFARRDLTPLAGFDEDAYAESALVDHLSMQDILAEYASLRQSTIQLYRNLDVSSLDVEGTANAVIYSPRSLGWMIAGHNKHHINVIQSRYL